MPRFSKIVLSSGAKAILTSKDYSRATTLYSAANKLRGRGKVEWPDVPWHVTDGVPPSKQIFSSNDILTTCDMTETDDITFTVDELLPASYQMAGDDDLAYLQYTSGSTGTVLLHLIWIVTQRKA